jgi:ABC-type dipeptide/oligopeptide/nickel transport system ATPase component
MYPSQYNTRQKHIVMIAIVLARAAALKILDEPNTSPLIISASSASPREIFKIIP